MLNFDHLPKIFQILYKWQFTQEPNFTNFQILRNLLGYNFPNDEFIIKEINEHLKFHCLS